MIIAQQKRKENIAEYLLYFFQIEDLIRAFQFDFNAIEKQLISNYEADEKTREEISAWYKNIVLIMHKEGIHKIGHLQFLRNLIEELNDFHLKLLENGNDKKYLSVFQPAAGLLTELRQKNNSSANDIQIALDAIYGFLLLKMQEKEVTPETTQAVSMLNDWLRSLSLLFKDFEEGKLDLFGADE